VWLFPHPAPVLPPGTFSPEIPGFFGGRLAKGEIVPADLCFSPAAPWCSNGTPQWNAFVADVEGGHVYLNLNTVAFRGGEIRGQVTVDG
jgi:hypothetical protein